ncbi:MAG: hypothetical protein QM811_28150 [Pirellulales bacterium]
MSRPFLSRRILLATAPNGYLAYDTDRDRLHELNATAALTVELCDGTRAEDEVIRTVVEVIGAEHADAATTWLRRAIAEGLLRGEPPTSPELEPSAGKLRKKAVAQREQGQLTVAYICYARAAEIQPELAKNWLELGDMARVIGRRGEARDAYERY